MTREMRVKLFLTEYKEICEKYGMRFDADMPECYTSSCKGEMYGSIIQLVDEEDRDVYPVMSAESYKESNSTYGKSLRAKVYSNINDKDGIVVSALDSMPEITEDYIGTVKQERTPEEARKRLAEMGINI